MSVRRFPRSDSSLTEMSRHHALDVQHVDALQVRLDLVAQHFLGELHGERLSGEIGEGEEARSSDPSRSRMFVLMLLASRSAISFGRFRPWSSAFFFTIATRVSRSGGLEVGHTPHVKRETSRSSQRRGSSSGGPSLVSTICLWASVERVERVEELLLRALLAREELDVVDQEHVRGAVAALELERRARAGSRRSSRS